LWTRGDADGVDIVASIIQQHDGWQSVETLALLDRLDLVARRVSYKHSLTETTARPKSILLDVGTNQGWFTMVSAARGFSVIAIEAMPENELLIKASVCENGFSDRVVVVGAAAGNTTETCFITSPAGDRGNGMVTCDLVETDAFGRKVEVLGTCPVVPIDNLLRQAYVDPTWSMKLLGAAKIDVEGFEPRCLQGLHHAMAGTFGSKLNSIVIEYNPSMIDRIDPSHTEKHSMLQLMERLGLSILQGGFITKQQGGGERGVPAGQVIGLEGVKAWEVKFGTDLGQIPDWFFERSS
jgi:FkbM family methyltransferase